MEGLMLRCWTFLLIITIAIISGYFWGMPNFMTDVRPVNVRSLITSTPKTIITDEKMATKAVIPHDARMLGRSTQTPVISDEHMATTAVTQAEVKSLVTSYPNPAIVHEDGIVTESDAMHTLVVFAHMDDPALTGPKLISAIDEVITKLCQLQISKAAMHLMISSVVNFNDTDFDVNKAISKYCPSFGSKLTLHSSNVSGERLKDPRELWHDQAFHWYLKDAKYFIIVSANASASWDINKFWTTCVNNGAAATSSGSICVNVSHYEATGFVVPARIHPLQVFPKSVVPNASLVYPPYQAWIPWLVCLHGEKTAVDFMANMTCNDTHRLSHDRYLLQGWMNRTLVRDPIRKEVSMTLYGDRLIYIYGLFRNAVLVHIFYPGWRLRVTLNRTIEDPIFTKKLESLGVHLVHTNESKMSKMMWRLLVADDPNVDVFIIRDADSRLNRREAILVNDWLKTDAAVHILRDNPAHKMPMMGGMWGARREPFMTAVKRPMRELIVGNNDQGFLATVIWPVVQTLKYRCLDSYYPNKFPGCQHLSMDRVDKEHVGQGFVQYNIPGSFAK